ALGNVTNAARTGTIRIGGTATFGADGTGSAQIDAQIVNSGFFRVTAGTLWFDGELDGTGTLAISAGATAGIGGVDTLAQTVVNEGTLLFWSP
ncbi:hypothetical protein, partial [Enterococcus faecalis]|uniref:hypothetical protein n=1 Tax=Enterococcus faecalis TaxID=1351 RepID=UPI00403F2CB7